MMTNLLSILVSLAMLMTGVSATALPDEAVGRVVTLGNLEARYDEEEAAATPYASMGVSTDGKTAVYDFYIGNDDDTLLPFRAVVSADQLLVRCDAARQTLRLTAEDLEALMAQSGMTSEADDDEVTAQLMDVYMNDYLPAYADLVNIMRDHDEMMALQARARTIYDELIDRGEPTPGEVELEGETYAVNNYEYTLDGAQMGALADAVYASDARFSAFLAAYFKLIALAPEETGLSGMKDFETLLASQDITFAVTESIGEGNLDIMDGVLTLSVQEMETPFEFNIHSTELGDSRFGSMDLDQTLGSDSVQLYLESSAEGRDMRVSMNVTVNPIEEDDGAAEGEGDAEDAFYGTLDFDRTWDEDAGLYSDSLSMTVDIAPTDTHLICNVSGQTDEQGLGDLKVDFSDTQGDHTAEVSFDVVVTDEVVEADIDETEAVALADLDMTALMTSVGADAMRLYGDRSVRDFFELLSKAFTEEAPANDGPAVTGDPDSLPFGNPSFEWLPEGYRVESIDVETEYETVTCTLVNGTADSTVTVDIGPSEDQDRVSYYTIKDDGFKAVDGHVMRAVEEDGYHFYTLDNGETSVTVSADDDSFTDIDALNLLIGLKF